MEIKELEHAEERRRLQIISEAEQSVKRYLGKRALGRYGNIKAADPSRALRIIGVLAQLIENGKITRQLSDEQFKGLLLHLNNKMGR